jgi:predicted dehydrogenase
MNDANLKQVLIIGVGSIGHRHLRCFLATGRVRGAICEVNAALAAQIAAQYGVEQVYHSLDQALAQRYDAAVITTPAQLHVPIATRLAGAGVHLLIEKPLGTTLDGIDELCGTVRRTGVVAAVAYVLRTHPSLRAMKAALDSGRFGRPVQLVAVCGQHFPTARPAYREIYYRDRATGGGAIQDALTHIVNAGQWLVGPVERLVADAAHQVLEGVEVEDTVHLLTRQGGVLGCYSLNQHQAPDEATLTVVCQRGTVRWEAHRQRWRWMERPGDAWHDEPAGEVPRDSLFVAQAQAFLDAIDGRGQPLCTLEEGIQTLRVNLAALESLCRQPWQEVGEQRKRRTGEQGRRRTGEKGSREGGTGFASVGAGQ